MSECEHDKTLCPVAFDCTPFCRICEGNSEYCPTCDSWESAIAMVINVVGVMYNSDTFDKATLEELRQRIV